MSFSSSFLNRLFYSVAVLSLLSSSAGAMDLEEQAKANLAKKTAAPSEEANSNTSTVSSLTPTAPANDPKEDKEDSPSPLPALSIDDVYRMSREQLLAAIYETWDHLNGWGELTNKHLVPLKNREGLSEQRLRGQLLMVRAQYLREERDYPSMRRFLEIACDMGEHGPLEIRVDLMEDGACGYTKNVRDSLEQTYLFAEKGHAWARGRMMEGLLEGKHGWKSNTALAAKMISWLASQGDEDAIFNMTEALMRGGLGFEKDMTRAIKLTVALQRKRKDGHVWRLTYILSHTGTEQERALYGQLHENGKATLEDLLKYKGPNPFLEVREYLDSLDPVKAAAKKKEKDLGDRKDSAPTPSPTVSAPPAPVSAPANAQQGAKKGNASKPSTNARKSSGSLTARPSTPRVKKEKDGGDKKGIGNKDLIRFKGHSIAWKPSDTVNHSAPLTTRAATPGVNKQTNRGATTSTASNSSANVRTRPGSLTTRATTPGDKKEKDLGDKKRVDSSTT